MRKVLIVLGGASVLGAVLVALFSTGEHKAGEATLFFCMGMAMLGLGPDTSRR